MKEPQNAKATVYLIVKRTVGEAWRALDRAHDNAATPLTPEVRADLRLVAGRWSSQSQTVALMSA